MDFHLDTYYPVFLFLLIVLGFAVTNLVATHVIGPRRWSAVKMMPYESGMDPIGDAWQRFDVRFYLVAILFLVFDVELLFLYPWAVSAYQPHPAMGVVQPASTQGVERVPALAESLIPAAFRDAIFWEILVFIATLAVAYVYAWRKGVFRWR